MQIYSGLNLDTITFLKIEQFLKMKIFRAMQFYGETIFKISIY